MRANAGWYAILIVLAVAVGLLLGAVSASRAATGPVVNQPAATAGSTGNPVHDRHD